MSDQLPPSDEPEKTMQEYLKSLAEITTADQQESGVRGLTKMIGDYYRGFLADGLGREDALDLTARLWAHMFKGTQSS